jgi:hypothetical protein
MRVVSVVYQFVGIFVICGCRHCRFILRCLGFRHIFVARSSNVIDAARYLILSFESLAKSISIHYRDLVAGVDYHL